MPDDLKNALDWGALGITVAAVASWLPPIAAALTIVWTGIRIWEWWRSKKALANPPPQE